MNSAELLTSSLSMQYVIELCAMLERCSPSTVFRAAMYKRPGTISRACTKPRRVSKACRRDSSILGELRRQYWYLRELVQLGCIVSERALRMLHGFTGPLARRAAPTSPLPPVAAFEAAAAMRWQLLQSSCAMQSARSKLLVQLTPWSSDCACT